MNKPVYFIHNAKTGGTSVHEIFKDIPKYNYHSHQHILIHVSKEELKNYFKFTFVRNPWGRMHSLFRHLCKEDSPIHSCSKTLTKDYYAKHYKGDFNYFMTEFAKGHTPFKYIFRSQAMITTYRSGLFGHVFIPDFVGKFETLQQDFNILCNMFGLSKIKLPHLRKSNHEDYKDIYNKYSKQAVSRLYREDIDLFNYDFDGVDNV